MDIRHLIDNTFQAFRNDEIVFQGSKKDCKSYLKIDDIKGKKHVWILSGYTYQVLNKKFKALFQGDITECYNFLKNKSK